MYQKNHTSTDYLSRLEYLESVLDSAGIGTWELDYTIQHISFCSRTGALINLPGNDTIELDHFLKQLQAADQATFRSEMHQAVSGFTSFSFHVHTTGEPRRLHCKGKASRDVGGNQVLILGTFTDISARAESTSIEPSPDVLAQKALEESNATLKAVIASAPAAIGLFVGRDLIVQLPNQAFIDIVGKGSDIEGIPLREVMPELESQPFLKILDDVYTSGITYQSYGTPVSIVRNGVLTRNFYDITYAPVRDADGKIYAILDIAIDVTKRVGIEKQIEESQLQLLSLFEQSPVGIAMIHKDDLTFTMANPFYGMMVGRKVEDIVGKPLLQALPEIEGQGFDKLLREVIETGTPYLAREHPVDISYNNVITTIYVDLAYQPQRDAKGEIIGVFVIATDLTQQVLSRRKIEEAQTFLKDAIELAELGTYSVDLNTGLVNYSYRMKEWFALTDKNLITLDQAYAAICEADLPGLTEAVNEAVNTLSDQPFDLEYTLDADKTGVARILHVQSRVMYDAQRKPISITGTAQDVTAQRKIKLALEEQVHQRTQELEAINKELATLNEEYVSINEELSESNNLLQQSNINLQQFAYVASHDLQEPLRKIQSFADLLIKRFGSNLGEGIDYLQRMQGSARRMSELIGDLLTFSSVTSQKNTHDVVELTEVVQEVLSDLELTIQESSASVSIHDLPAVKGDRMQLSHLFLNLISNALKYRKPGVNPIIDISGRIISASALPKSVNVVRSSGRYHQIDVADNGIGFDPQYAQRIFQLFQRLHGRGEYSGTGIGLAICEQVAARHGGGIWAVGKPGEGATFSVFLPVQ